MHLSVRLLDPDLLGQDTNGDAAFRDCGPRSDGRCAEWAASVPCNANDAHEFEVPVCPGVHIIQVVAYNDEYAELGLERRDVRVFEVMSADEERRLVRYRREESGNQNIPYNRANIINRIIAARQYQSYLEVGVRSGITFRSVSCAHKESVDPNKDDLFPELTHHMTSDEAFAHFRAAGKECFDLIFIDGLHEADQVFWRCMHASRKHMHVCMLMMHARAYQHTYMHVHTNGQADRPRHPEWARFPVSRGHAAAPRYVSALSITRGLCFMV